MNRDQLLQRIESSRKEWDQLIAAVPTEMLDEPLWENGWAIKHVIAHVDFYQWWMAEFIRRRDWPVVDQRLDTWDMDARNNAWFEINRDRSAADILAESPRIHQNIVKALSGLTEEDLVNPSYLLDPPPGDGFSVLEMAKEMSFQHYPMHIPDIEAFLARIGTG